MQARHLETWLETTTQYKNFVYENIHSSLRAFKPGSYSFKMILNLHNFYHPYYNSSLEFLSVHDLDQTNMSEGEIVDEIDLYYQPLEKPSIVISFFCIKILVICTGEVISTKLVTSLNKEKALSTDVTKFFIISQMILQPILIFLDLIINLIYPVKKICASNSIRYNTASTLNVFKAKFVKLDEHYVNIKSLGDITIRICNIIEAILFIFMGFNITESFLYYKIFNKIDR